MNQCIYWPSCFLATLCFRFCMTICCRLLGIQSVIATQNCSHIIIWSPNLNRNDFPPSLFACGNETIEVRHWDYQEQVRGTPLENVHEPSHDDVSFSDWVRTILLHNYGGVYFDLDVVFLRNLQPLLSQQFWYRWSCWDYPNTAVFHLKAHSIESATLMQYGHKGNFHPRKLGEIADSHKLNITMFNCVFFDPLWRWFDCDEMPLFHRPEFTNFMKDSRWANPVSDNFFPGAFAHHWHNQWDTKPGERSWFLV